MPRIIFLFFISLGLAGASPAPAARLVLDLFATAHATLLDELRDQLRDLAQRVAALQVEAEKAENLATSYQQGLNEGIARNEMDQEDRDFAEKQSMLFRLEAEKASSDLRRAKESENLALTLLPKLEADRELLRSRGEGFATREDYFNFAARLELACLQAQQLILMQSLNALQTQQHEAKHEIARATVDIGLLEDSLKMDFTQDEKARTRLDIANFRRSVERWTKLQTQCESEGKVLSAAISSLQQQIAHSANLPGTAVERWANAATTASLADFLALLSKNLTDQRAQQVEFSRGVIETEIRRVQNQMLVQKNELKSWRQLEESDQAKGITSPLTTESIQQCEAVLSRLTKSLTSLAEEKSALEKFN